MSPERGNPRRVDRMTARHSQSTSQRALKEAAGNHQANYQGRQRDEPGAG